MAFLLDNPRVQVVFSSNFSLQFLPDSLAQLMRGQYEPGGVILVLVLRREVTTDMMFEHDRCE